jgi:hypothetical protein
MYEHTLMKWQLSDPAPPPWRGWRVELRPALIALLLVALILALGWVLSLCHISPGWHEAAAAREARGRQLGGLQPSPPSSQPPAPLGLAGCGGR